MKAFGLAVLVLAAVVLVAAALVLAGHALNRVSERRIAAIMAAFDAERAAEKEYLRGFEPGSDIAGPESGVQFTLANLQRIAELLNAESGRTLVERVSAWSPGDGTTRVEIQFNGAPTTYFVGGEAAAAALHTARLALQAHRAASTAE